MIRLTRALALAGLGMVLLPATIGSQGKVDPKAVQFQKPDEIKFVRNAAGTQETAVLFGDPAKPGPYVIRLRWLPGNMSRPHSHPNDRFFVVISGTWWLGSGEKYDPNSTVGVGPGTYVIHHAGQVHYDGAKDEPAVIQVWGMGPATSTNREAK
jgi:quercetin dioxygenase-like cupin family protein